MIYGREKIDKETSDAAWAEEKCGAEYCRKLREDLRQLSLLTTDGPRRALRMLLQVEAAATLAVYYSVRYSEPKR